MLWETNALLLESAVPKPAHRSQSSYHIGAHKASLLLVIVCRESMCYPVAGV